MSGEPGRKIPVIKGGFARPGRPGHHSQMMLAGMLQKALEERGKSAEERRKSARAQGQDGPSMMPPPLPNRPSSSPSRSSTRTPQVRDPSTRLNTPSATGSRTTPFRRSTSAAAAPPHPGYTAPVTRRGATSSTNVRPADATSRTAPASATPIRPTRISKSIAKRKIAVVAADGSFTDEE